jgi:hypothetical protein
LNDYKISYFKQITAQHRIRDRLLIRRTSRLLNNKSQKKSNEDLRSLNKMTEKTETEKESANSLIDVANLAS